MKGQLRWSRFLFSFLFSLSVFFLGFSSTSYGAEVCTDKTEFIIHLQQHKLLKEKTRIQAKYISELKAHLAEQDHGIAALTRHGNACDVLVAEYERQHADLKQELKDHEYNTWVERGKGFGVGFVVVMLGVLIFK